jgi:hypothetical protein
MLGAACIAVVRNQFNPGDISYVFGGDGASIVVPKEHLETLMNLLRAVQLLAQSSFQLEIRVGQVSVKELYEAKAKVFVEELSYGDDEKSYLFLGDGFSLADRWIKERSDGIDAANHCGNDSLPSLKVWPNLAAIALV